MTRLTKRETQVAALLGKTNAKIAARLCISELPVSDLSLPRFRGRVVKPLFGVGFLLIR